MRGVGLARSILREGRIVRRILLWLAGLVAVLPMAAAAAGPAHVGHANARPATLVSTPMPIYSFAEDDRMLAWEQCCDGEYETRSTIKVRAALGGRSVTVSRPDGGDGAYVMDLFAVGGSRLVWGGFVDCCNNGYGTVETAAAGSRPKTLRSLDLDEWAWGDYPTGAAGDGATLVYTLARVEPSYGDDDVVDSWAVTGGSTWRVVGRGAVRVPGTPPVALLAAARGTIALVPADRRRFRGPCSDDNPLGCAEVRVAPNTRVEVRDAVAGALRASFVPTGRISALGMDAETVVVLARSGGEAQVAWYSARSGALLEASKVPRGVNDVVDVSGRTIVLRLGKTILAIDTRTGRVRELAQASSTPIGLSIEGTRVAWAENAKTRGAIRAVTVG